MSPALISIILWAPFLLVMVISASIFCISGYKRGIWRALISLGITIVSAIISIFLSKLLAGVTSAGICKSVVDMLPEEITSMSFISSLVEGIIQAVFAVLIFSIVFLILTLILKIVGNVVKPDELRVETTGLKWAGLGVRVLDAFIYTLLLLLPLYGTLGTYAPTVQSLLKMSGETSAEVVSYFEAVTGHPIVFLSKNTPVNLVYGQLSSVQVNDVNVNVAEMVTVVEETMVKIEALATVPEDEFDDACLDLVQHMKTKVIDSDWSYELMTDTTDVIKDQLLDGMKITMPGGADITENVFDMLISSKEDFKDNSYAVLDYMEYALQNDVMENIQDGNLKEIETEEFYKETADFLNATEHTTDIKMYLIEEAVTTVLDGDEAAADQIMDSYDDSAVSSANEQQEEIEALVAITSAKNSEEVKKALMDVPSLDDDVISEVFDKMNNND